MVTQLPRVLRDSVSESNLNVEKGGRAWHLSSRQQCAKMLWNRSLIKEGSRAGGTPALSFGGNPIWDFVILQTFTSPLPLPQPQPHEDEILWKDLTFKKKLCNVWVKKNGEVKGGIREGKKKKKKPTQLFPRAQQSYFCLLMIDSPWLLGQF